MGKLSSSFAGIAIAILLLLCIYDIVKACSPLILRISHRRRNPRSSIPEHPSLEFEGGGLAAEVIDMLQAVQYSEASRVSPSDCAICLAEFAEGEWLRVLPGCSHGFHMQCIDTWLFSHSDCPLCRKQVVANVCDATPCLPVAVSLQSLPREGISHDRLLDYGLMESEAMHNEALRSDARGMESLV